MDEEEFNELLQHLRDNESCFRRLYNYYYPKIVFYITENFDENIAQDVAQDFFKLLLLKSNLPKHVKYPTWWVMRSCDNIAVKTLESDKNAHDRERRASKSPEDTARLLDPEFTDLRDLVKVLDDQTERIVVMHVCEGYGFKELAALFNMSYENVRQRCCRGLKLMREVDEERSRDIGE